MSQKTGLAELKFTESGQTGDAEEHTALRPDIRFPSRFKGVEVIGTSRPSIDTARGT